MILPTRQPCDKPSNLYNQRLKRRHTWCWCGQGVPGHLSLDCVEALAIRQVFVFIKDIDFSKIIVESDCKQAIDRLNVLQNDYSYFDILIGDCLNFRRDFVTSNLFVYAVQLIYMGDHDLVALTQTSDSIIFSIYWSEDIHSSIIPLVVKDIEA